MPTPTTQTILTLVTFGLTTLLVGGYLGGEMARRRQVKEDIKAIQQEHEKTLARIDSVVQRAGQNELAVLAQIDSVYSILGELNAQETKTRSKINTTTARINKAKQDAAQIKEEIRTAGGDSEITLKKKSSN